MRRNTVPTQMTLTEEEYDFIQECGERFDTEDLSEDLTNGPEVDIEQAVSPWLPDAACPQSLEKFDSSLVDSPINSYLNPQEQLPHLWLED